MIYLYVLCTFKNKSSYILNTLLEKQIYSLYFIHF